MKADVGGAGLVVIKAVLSGEVQLKTNAFKFLLLPWLGIWDKNDRRRERYRHRKI